MNLTLAEAVKLIPQKIYEWTHPNEPWLAQGAVRFLGDYLKPDMRGFEWGSGRSSLWFGERLAELHTIEYNEAWYARVQQMIADADADATIHLQFIPLDHDLALPTQPIYPETPQYAQAIDGFADASFDMIVVDGHYRQACVLAALSKAKSGGLIVIDNYNRLPYSEWGIPNSWELAHKSRNARTETAIFRRP